MNKMKTDLINAKAYLNYSYITCSYNVVS